MAKGAVARFAAGFHRSEDGRASGEPLGTLWVVSPEEEHFSQSDARVLSEFASFVGIALKMQRGRAAPSPVFSAQEPVASETWRVARGQAFA
jgi:hypothetical protein